MTKSVVFASLSLAALIGCGGDDPKKPVITTPDAPGGTTVDAPTEAGCTGPTAIPSAMLTAFEYTADALPDTAGNQELWSTGGRLDQNALTDVLLINFGEGPAEFYTFENFPNVTAQNPLTVPLTGGEADATKCSVCISMVTDYNTANMQMVEYADDYQANAGSVTFTALSPQKITGTITGVTMRHVDVDFEAMPATQTENPSGCTTMMGEVSFDAVPTPAMAKNGKLGFRLAMPRAATTQLAN